MEWNPWAPQLLQKLILIGLEGLQGPNIAPYI